MKYKKVFIAAPTVLKSGGPETLHQFCGFINKNYPNRAYIVYVDGENRIDNHDAIENYERYGIQIADEVEDNSDNLLIVPEVHTNFLKKYHNINKMVCWLSYAFYFPFLARFSNELRYNKLFKAISPFVKVVYFAKNPKLVFSNSKLPVRKMKNIKISYNTLEEKYYLHKKGIKTNNYLCGPIADEYFIGDVIPEKKNIISYNPKKGYKFTEKVILEFKKRYGDKYSFVAIENMSSQQVVQTLKDSVLYIDFGYFPGHERIPRQACLCFANTIVSRFGSAKYKDIDIPEQYKFNVDDKNIGKIVDTMIELADNHEKHIDEFDSYRRLSKWQRDVFEQEVIAICEDKEFDLEKEWFDKL